MNPGADKPLFNAYVDGFNLYMGALHRRPHLRWLDLLALCAALRPDMQLNKVYYFTARLKELYPGDPEPRRQHAYLRVLQGQGIEVVYGKFRKDARWFRLAAADHRNFYSPKLPGLCGLTGAIFAGSFNLAAPDLPKVFVFDMEEKGSDVNLASHLLRDAYQGKIPACVLVSGDSDLVKPIEFAVQAGMNVKVVVPNREQNIHAFRSSGAMLEQLKPSDLSASQLCDPFVTPSGRQIHKPKLWT